MGRNMDSLKDSLLKCTTASETLVMHRTTFLCLSLVLASDPMRRTAPTIGDRKLGSIWKNVIKSLIALTEASSLREHLRIDGRLATRDSADRQRKSVR